MKANCYGAGLFALFIQGTITPSIANEWPISEPNSLRSGHLKHALNLKTPENQRKLFQEQTFQNFDPSLLSREDTKVNLRITIDSKSHIKIIVASRYHASAKDIFYCEQAVYDNPIRYANFSIEVVFNKESKGTRSLPELKSENNSTVKVHLVPFYILDRVDHLLEEDIQASANVENLLLKQSNRTLLTLFRSFWPNYLAKHKHPTRAEIAEQQKKMRQEFKELFLPHQ